MSEAKLDAAQVGKMFVTNVTFEWHGPNTRWNGETRKDETIPGHWDISARLSEKADRYSGSSQTMSIQVEQGVGAKLAEVLLPVIVADASRKAQQLADESKAMLAALGERAQLCITNMPAEAK